MRVIGYLLLSFLLIAILSAAASKVFEWQGTADFLAGPGGIRASRSTAYRLSSTDWLEFGLAEHGPVRVLSNCEFSSPKRGTARYAVDYEIFDSSGLTVVSGQYHHLAQITFLIDSERPDDSSPISKTSYADNRNPGSNAADFWIEAPGLSLPGRLRVRIAEQAPTIAEVAVRAYQRSELSPRKAESAWQRLSRRKREQLTRGFAVSSEWLAPFETTALARFDWRPLGPRGVEGQDYEERVLLVVSDPKFVRLQSVSSPSARGTLRRKVAIQ